jgi:hypothetical protein
VIFLLAAAMVCGCLGVRTPPVSISTPPALFVEYHRSGGTAGLDDHLVIFDNGVVVISAKSVNTELMLNQTDLDRITAIFNEAQFTMLDPSYSARRGEPDFIKYTISYHSKTVNTEMSAVPPRLQPVIDELDRIMEMGMVQERVVQPFMTLSL